MLGTSPDQNQLNLFNSTLKQILNPKHTLVLLTVEMPWHKFDQFFKHLYSEVGMPGKPIRLMVGLLILKQLKNLSDEEIVKQWVQNPYFQYFCGESEFRWKIPCDPSDITHFRNRIGKDGFKKIFDILIDLRPEVIKTGNKKQKLHSIMLDATSKEKNLTYPINVKLNKSSSTRARK